MNRQLVRRNARRLLLSLAFSCFVGLPFVQAGPVFEYQFPASWDGTGTAVTDQSPAGNHGTTTGAPTLSANVPPGAPIGSQSIHTVNGGLRTNNTALLTNALIAAAGGFRMDATFNWDDTDNPQHVLKIIDYAGTEFLQLQAVNTTAQQAILRFGFSDNASVGTSLITPVVPNQWYSVTGIFDTQGNTVAGNGSLSGVATLIVNGVPIASEAVTKTSFGDNLSRPIGVGNFSNSAAALLQFRGDLYNPSVALIPEPMTAILAVWGLVVSALIFVRRHRS